MTSRDTSPELELITGPAGTTLRVDGADWLTVASTTTAGSVEFTSTAVDGSIRFTITATDEVAFEPAGFAEPQVIHPALEPTPAFIDAGGRTFGYQHMEFALPARGRPNGHGLAPWPLRPPAAMPVIWFVPTPDGGDGAAATSDRGAAVLVGPLDQFHDQVMAVSSKERVRSAVECGWHGDLEHVDAGWSTTMVALAAPDPRAAVDAYGRLIAQHHHARPLARYADPAVSGLSYWTDNGATYYYRAEGDLDYPTTLAAAVERLRADDIPIHAMQLDSWFYPHQLLRELREGAPSVPSTGTTVWEPRDDALPDGIAALHRSTGLPLVFHSRHLHRDSPYFEAGRLAGWLDEESGHAHPADAELYEIWMEQVAAWGGCTYEQDWLVEMFLTVRSLRNTPGRATAWQRAIDAAAARRGLTLQWCMATPADLLGTVHLSRVSSVRTSMDFDYVVARPANWGWFLHVNALARSLGLNTSKDVFLASRSEDGTYEDPLAEAETLLAALSCGPVGIGDRIGSTDRELVMRTCRADGVLVMPDVPVAALAGGFVDPMPDAGTLWGECHTDHPSGRYHYVIAVHAGEIEPSSRQLLRSDLDGATPGSLIAHRWTTGEVAAWDDVVLDPSDRAFDLWLVAPTVADGRLAVFGDVSRYASVGDRRIGHLSERDGGATMLVLGAAGEAVTVTGWSTAAPITTSWTSDGTVALDTIHDRHSGRWQVGVVVGTQGWVRLQVALG